MSRHAVLLLLAALALAALGAYDVMRGPAELTPGGPAGTSTTLELTTTRTPIGTVVTSGGATLYRFDKDTATPAKSTCAGNCAATWVPLRNVNGAPALNGIDAALVGIVVRADGAEQVTLGGWPLYRYSGDQASGQTRGEGVDGVWHAIGPAGKPAVGADKQKSPPPTSAPRANPGSGVGGNGY